MSAEGQITIETIRFEIEKAQQPLLERIAELERLVDVASDDLWALNCFVWELMRHFPQEHAQEASNRLSRAWHEAPIDQRNSPAGQSVSAQVRMLRQAAQQFRAPDSSASSASRSDESHHR
ncbi:hypothetical protein ACR2R6_12885 [Methylocaldum gracile subsp. desertum]|jgi:predicted GTPase|uniref:hypothetical protein n=1 Tax=Methylocaldum sp. GT1BW TaxID=3438964 RepID=UPI003DA1725C